MKEKVILKQFFEAPMYQFGVRELSRKTKLDTKTVIKYLKKFVNQKIVIKTKHKKKFAKYEANRLARSYKILKTTSLLQQIATSKLIDYLETEVRPRAIVIFGSVQKGTYLKHSDIDFFIQGKQKTVNLALFEHKLKRNINLFFEENLQNLTVGLRNNIINGSTVSGGLEL